MKLTYPRISIVTPSFNQADYLEKTILSVLNQGYPNLEYIIIDGGSTDGSFEIIKKYASQLSYWVSEPDNGQSHAINKGLKLATGDWVGWQNSDDVYYPKALMHVAQRVVRNRDVDLVIGDINLIAEDGAIIRDVKYVKPTYNALLAEGMVLTNQAAFWKRNIHQSIGYLDESLHFGFDYEWFLRLLKFTNRAAHIPLTLGALRYHSETKTSQSQQKFHEEYSQILKDKCIPNWKKRVYKLRRLLLTLLNGELLYLLRGISNQLTGKRNFKNASDLAEK